MLLTTANTILLYLDIPVPSKYKPIETYFGAKVFNNHHRHTHCTACCCHRLRSFRIRHLFHTPYQSLSLEPRGYMEANILRSSKMCDNLRVSRPPGQKHIHVMKSRVYHTSVLRKRKEKEKKKTNYILVREDQSRVGSVHVSNTAPVHVNNAAPVHVSKRTPVHVSKTAPVHVSKAAPVTLVRQDQSTLVRQRQSTLVGRTSPR